MITTISGPAGRQVGIFAERIGEGTGNLILVKPAVGFTLPSAGVTPAPGEKY